LESRKYIRRSGGWDADSRQKITPDAEGNRAILRRRSNSALLTNTKRCLNGAVGKPVCFAARRQRSELAD
jgi:hypothetical protein